MAHPPADHVSTDADAVLGDALWSAGDWDADLDHSEPGATQRGNDPE